MRLMIGIALAVVATGPGASVMQQITLPDTHTQSGWRIVDYTIIRLPGRAPTVRVYQGSDILNYSECVNVVGLGNVDNFDTENKLKNSVTRVFRCEPTS
jgi:hypothetical protein